MRAFSCVLLLTLVGCGAESRGSGGAQDAAPVASVAEASVAEAAVSVDAPLDLGSIAPAFRLPGSDGAHHQLSDYAGQHVVLAFFPKAFTGG